MGPERFCAMHEDIFVEKWEARGRTIFFGSLVSMLLPVSGELSIWIPYFHLLPQMLLGLHCELDLGIIEIRSTFHARDFVS